MEYMSQLIGYFCACGSYHDFLDKRVAAYMETNMVGSHLSDFLKSDFLFHIHFSVVICDFLVISA
jgi:hypothetical protein